jgi:hypothetical protein
MIGMSSAVYDTTHQLQIPDTLTDKDTDMIMPIQRIHDNPPHRIQLYFIAPLLQRVAQLHTRRRPMGTGHAVEGIVVDDGVAWCRGVHRGVVDGMRRCIGDPPRLIAPIGRQDKDKAVRTCHSSRTTLAH